MKKFKFIRNSGDRANHKYLVRAFIGSMTKSGKKTKATRLFNAFLYDIGIKFNTPPVDFLDNLIETIRPKVFLISKKISGSTVRIPTPITLGKSYSIGIKWFLSSVSKRHGSPFNQLMFFELLDIYANPANQTLKKRDEYHKLAKLNRPFLKYAKI
jgi:small subunit ribosomal protein S7